MTWRETCLRSTAKHPNGLTMQCGINDIWNQSQVSPCNNCGRTQSRLSHRKHPLLWGEGQWHPPSSNGHYSHASCHIAWECFPLGARNPSAPNGPTTNWIISAKSHRGVSEIWPCDFVVLPLFLLPYLVKMIQCYHSCINLPWTGTCHAFVWLFCLGFCALLLFGGFAFGFWQPTGLCAGPIPVHSWGPSISRRPCMR